MSNDFLFKGSAPSTDTRDAQHAALAADVEDFLKRGGKIQSIPTGLSATDLARAKPRAFGNRPGRPPKREAD